MSARSAGSQELPSPEQMRERAASVDIGDEVDLGPAFQRDRHVDDVAGAQVDLGWASGALDDDPVEVADQAVERGLDHRPEARPALEPGQFSRERVVAAHDDDLAVRVRLGFQEDRIYSGFGRNASCEGLDVLGAPDLASRRVSRPRWCSCSGP